MAGSKRKNVPPSTDFKRIKAKVGKKALKPLNDTDVSFKSASLRLSGQSIQHDDKLNNKFDNRQALLSSRGKSLIDLLLQISHPAANARSSSLKGILDIIKMHPPKFILPNLSALIPACVHSCVDEDADVRSLGIDTLSALLSKLNEEKIQPFAELLIARVSSALHSLDASTRIDGVRMAKLVSSSCPYLTATFVNQLLYPFPSLIADHRTKKAIDEILQSLISLLRVTTAKRQVAPTAMSSSYPRDDNIGKRNSYQPHDLIYIPNSSGSRNSILSTGRPLRFSNVERSYNKRKNPNIFSSGTKYKTNLMAKLRDSLVETINLEFEPIMASNRLSKSASTEPQGGINHARIILLLRSIRYLHQNSVTTSHTGHLDDDDIEFDKLTQQIASVLMDSFPINQDFSSVGKSTRVEDVNAAIAITIVEVTHMSCTRYEEEDNSSSVLNDSNTKKWMQNICSYVIPRIKYMAEVSTDVSSSDLDVICKIIRQHERGYELFSGMNIMLGILQEFFFQNEDIQLARSAAGRRISLVVMDLIEGTNFQLGNDSVSPISNVLTQFVATMPFYLEAWASDFLYESQRILEGLHQLVREVEDNCDSAGVKCLRNNLYRFVKDRGNSSSMFEIYPWRLQKTFLGLMVLLKNPDDRTLKNFASICTRLTLNHESYVKKEALVEAIVQAIQSIRKTVPMKRYLTFLVQSIGISSHVNEILRVEAITVKSKSESTSKNIFDEAFFTADPILHIVARTLIQSGSMNVLQMIYPQLLSWQQTRMKEGESSMEFIFKTRSSHTILAHFFLMYTKQKNQVGKQSSIFDTLDGVMSVDDLTDSICRFIHFIVRNKEAMQASSNLISPIIAIMSSETCVFNSVISKITDWFQTGELSRMDKNNILLIFTDWMNDPRLTEALSGATSSSRMNLNLIRVISGSEELQDSKVVLNLVSMLSTK